MAETKPEIPNRRKSSDNKSSGAAFLGILLVFFALYFIFKRPKRPPPQPPAAAQTQTERESEAEEPPVQANPSETRGSPRDLPTHVPSPTGLELPPASRPVDSMGSLFFEKNQKVISSFSNTAHLNIPHIPGMQYLELDIADDIAGINAFDPFRKMHLTILARAGTVTDDLLMEFLSESNNGVPALNGISVPRLGPPQSLPAASGSGLKDAKVWSFMQGGQTINIALMERQDGKGSYLAVINSPGTFLSEAEEHYEQFYENMRVR